MTMFKTVVKTMRRTSGLWLLLALLLSACQPIQQVPATQTAATVSAETPLEQANQAVVQRFYEEVVNQKKLEVFQEVFDPHMVAHDLGRASAITDTVLLAGLPDLHIKVDLWVLQGDLVTAVVTASGTHQAAIMGIAPTGNKVIWSSIDVWRVKGGKITDVWHNFPNQDILQQIGYTLVPPTK
jgi:predicted ester cyclase